MGIQHWLQPSGSKDALYLRLQSNLEDAIRRGELKPGSKLPAERDLAERLRVSRTTVTNAYRELEAKGLVRGFVGRGTYVCAVPEPTNVPFAWQGKMSATSLRLSSQSMAFNRDSAEPRPISFARGCPALECFPLEEYQRIERSVLARGPSDAFGVGPVPGQPALRKAIAKQRSVRPEQVLVVAGAQQGLDLLARSLVDPGDNVIVETPGYFIAFQTFRAAGARLVGWDAPLGDIHELENLILRHHPKFICTSPSFQNPTGRTLSLAQRKDLIQLAIRYRIPLIEDEPYRETYFDAPPPPSLHELDERGIVIHLGTFSKVLAPGLRLGYIIAQENVVDLLARAKQRASIFTPGLEQLVLAEMLAQGALDIHLPQLRKEHKLRRDAMVAALRQVFPKDLLDFSMPSGGLYLWTRLSMKISAAELSELAIHKGVIFSPGELFYTEAVKTPQIRLCFANSTTARIMDGVKKMRSAFDSAQPTKQRSNDSPEFPVFRPTTMAHGK